MRVAAEGDGRVASRSRTAGSASRARELRKIFQRFYRAGATCSAGGGPRASACSSCATWCAARAARVVARSEGSGRGSRFVVTLRARRERRRRAAASARAEPAMTRILVVEDEEHLAEGLRFNLEAEGYEVEIARRRAERRGAARRAERARSIS